jgi:hypothetical protein
MIKNNTLGDRLNKFKKKKDNTPNNFYPTLNKSILDILNSVYTIFLLITRILIYGYASKILFTTTWNFWETCCIGLAITLILGYIRGFFIINKVE